MPHHSYRVDEICGRKPQRAAPCEFRSCLQHARRRHELPPDEPDACTKGRRAEEPVEAERKLGSRGCAQAQLGGALVGKPERGSEAAALRQQPESDGEGRRSIESLGELRCRPPRRLGDPGERAGEIFERLPVLDAVMRRVQRHEKGASRLRQDCDLGPPDGHRLGCLPELGPGRFGADAEAGQRVVKVDVCSVTRPPPRTGMRAPAVREEARPPAARRSNPAGRSGHVRRGVEIAPARRAGRCRRSLAATRRRRASAPSPAP